MILLLDGEGRPRFIWRTTEVTIKPLSQVDETFAGTRGKGTEREIGGSMLITAISLGKRAEKDSSSTTISPLSSSGLRSYGRSMSRIRP